MDDGMVTRTIVGMGDIRVVEAHDLTAGTIAPVDHEIVAKPIAQWQRDVAPSAVRQTEIKSVTSRQLASQSALAPPSSHSSPLSG